MTVHELSRADARRIAVRAQLLHSERPAGLLTWFATADRKAGVLMVNAIHQDVPFDKAMAA